MFKWIKKLHTWAGLLAFSAFIVWGAAGIHGVFMPAPGTAGPPDVSDSRRIPFQAPGSLSDADLAERILAGIDAPRGSVVRNVHRDRDANLVFFVNTANGRNEVTLLEDSGTVRIDTRRIGLGAFISGMHTSHSRRGPRTIPARIWGFYNEFSTWAFLFMTGSGVYMWVATRPRLRWAQLIGAAAVATPVILWLVTR